MKRALAEDLSERARDLARHFGAQGLRYTGCTYMPRDEVCVVRVESPDCMAVSELIAQLGITGARVSEVVDLPPRVVRRTGRR